MRLRPALSLPGAALLALVISPRTGAQEIRLGDDLRTSAAHTQHVELATGSVHVRAGASEWVALRFQVDPGFHINSHTPHDELLVPTTVVAGTGALKVVAQRYPPGVPLRLEVSGGETLSTYQGEFQVDVQLVAPKGENALTGTLRYQACDARACFPPRNLPLRVTVTAE